MTLKQMAQEALSLVQKSGIDKGQATFTRSEIHELELQGESINLCRTYFKDNFSIKAVQAKRQAKASLNRWDEASQTQLIQDLQSGLEASPEDSAYDILESSEQKSFEQAAQAPDLEALAQSIREFLGWAKKAHPKIHFESSPIKFVKTHQVMANTSGLCLEASDSNYSGFLMFTAKDGQTTSSFNYVDFTTKNVPTDIKSLVGLENMLQLTERELNTPVDAADIKDVVLTPYALADLLSFFTAHISTGSLMSGTSVFKDKLNEKIASDKLSLYSLPTDSKFASFEPYTADGLLTENGAIIEKGVLKSYLLDLYGSHKLQMTPATLLGSYLSVAPGAKPLAEMISGIERGILLTRVSGGAPSANGDFSAVAKNSFLIENGEITRPVKETMIAGNLVRLFQQIEDISQDTINFGTREMPWIHAQL